MTWDLCFESSEIEEESEFSRMHVYNLLEEALSTQFENDVLGIGLVIPARASTTNRIEFKAGDTFFSFKPKIEYRGGEAVINVLTAVRSTRIPNPFHNVPPSIITFRNFPQTEVTITPFFGVQSRILKDVPNTQSSFNLFFVKTLVRPIIEAVLRLCPAFVNYSAEAMTVVAQDAPSEEKDHDEATVIQLYDVNALKKDLEWQIDGDPSESLFADDYGDDQRGTSRQAKIHKWMISKGDIQAQRRLQHATAETLAKLQEIMKLAPQMQEVSALVENAVKSSLHTKTPIRISPILINGPTGSGKTWYAQSVSEALRLPLQKIPMTGVTLSELFIGANPQWRGADLGAVASMLLKEKIANGMIFIDEFDKISANPHNKDPFRAFYTLFEPETANTFRDEYLNVPLRADGLIWIATSNSIADIPAPILDRMNVFEIGEIDREKKSAIAQTIYEIANRRHHLWFKPILNDEVVAAVISHSLRQARKLIDSAMAKASAENRRFLTPKDIVAPKGNKERFGF